MTTRADRTKTEAEKQAQKASDERLMAEFRTRMTRWVLEEQPIENTLAVLNGLKPSPATADRLAALGQALTEAAAAMRGKL